ncbi:MAG: hypothetical protein ACRD9L_14135, partial [Bryobacteraceae bacterium]
MRQRKALLASAKRNSIPAARVLIGIGLFGLAVATAHTAPITEPDPGVASSSPVDVGGPANLAQMPEPAPLLLLGGGLVCFG